jgi:hypothetical protein
MTTPTSTCRLRGLPSRLWPWAPSLGGPWPFEVRRGQVVEREIDLEGKQVSKAQIELTLDQPLAGVELIQRPVPLLELPQGDADPRQPARAALDIVAPHRHPAPTAPIANEVGLQPPG